MRRCAPARFYRGPRKPHAGLFGRSLAFPQIAVPARNDEVVPGVPPATGSRQDVIHVQLTDAGLIATVLTAVPVPQEQVPPGQTDAESRSTIIPEQMQDSRNAERAATDRELVVRLTHRKIAPPREIVGIPLLVQSQRHPREQEHHGAPDAGHTDWREVPIQEQDRNVENAALRVRGTRMAAFGR